MGAVSLSRREQNGEKEKQKERERGRERETGREEEGAKGRERGEERASEQHSRAPSPPDDLRCPKEAAGALSGSWRAMRAQKTGTGTLNC